MNNAKYRLTRIIFFGLSISCIIIGQAPDTLWTRQYGTPENDCVYSIVSVLDSQFIMSGETRDTIAGKAWLIKIKSNGDTIWTRSYGQGNTNNSGREVRPLANGGYIIAGETCPFNTIDCDLLLIKTEDAGDTVWIRFFGGDSTDFGHSVDNAPDGGYIATGYTRSFGNGEEDLFLIKVDTLGNWQFAKTYGGSGMDVGNSVRTTVDLGFIICGLTRSFSISGIDGWLLKTDTLGDTLWTKTYNYGSADALHAVRPLTDGGYIMTGTTYNGSNYDLSLIRTDSLGNVLWSKFFDGGSDDMGYSVEPTLDGGFIIGGGRYATGSGGENYWILKTDSFGDTLWTKTLGGPFSEECRSVIPTLDNGYLAAGVKRQAGGNGNGWLVKLGWSGTVTDLGQTMFFGPCRVRINPVRGKPVFDVDLHESGEINLKIYDVEGRLVTTIYSGCMASGKHTLTGPGDLNAGIYFYQLGRSDGSSTGKFVLIR